MRLISFILLILVMTKGHAFECKGIFQDPDYLRLERQCDAGGQVVYIRTIISENDFVAREEWFKDGHLSESKFYRDGEAFSLSRFHYPSSNFSYYIRTDFDLPEMKLNGKETIERIGDEQFVLSHLYVDDGKPTHEVFYNRNKQLLKRTLLDRFGNIEKIIKFYYQSVEEAKPYAFVTTDIMGKELARYNRNTHFDFDDVYQQLSSDELARRRDHFEDKNRIVVSVVDSGVDIFHPDLAYKMYLNPDESLDGVDEDNNGLVDDIMGWAEPAKSGFPHESISPNEKGVPASHGTHVASILSRDIEGIAILPFVGDYGEAFFLNKMRDEFVQKNVQFANMSFSFPHYRTQKIERATIQALQSLISSNLQTLFVVAAGNDGKELGNGVFQAMYPAVFPYDHVFTIGALDTDFLRESEMAQNKMADYSNYSESAVDILAPGTKVDGASLGGGNIRHTGTSMASPYALREALVLKIKYPKLSGLEIKEIMMRSAYIPDIDHPFPVRSGGMIFPRRAQEVAKIYLEENLTIEQAALKVRRNGQFLLTGESPQESYLAKIIELWQARGV